MNKKLAVHVGGYETSDWDNLERSEHGAILAAAMKRLMSDIDTWFAFNGFTYATQPLGMGAVSVSCSHEAANAFKQAAEMGDITHIARIQDVTKQPEAGLPDSKPDWTNRVQREDFGR